MFIEIPEVRYSSYFQVTFHEPKQLYSVPTNPTQLSSYSLLPFGIAMHDICMYQSMFDLTSIILKNIQHRKADRRKNMFQQVS